MIEAGSFWRMFEWVGLTYLLVLNFAYFVLDLVSFAVLRRHRQRQTLSVLHNRYSNLELPVSLIIPAFNEEATVAATVRSLLQLNYARFEIVVVNDGSNDRTLEVLKTAFGLEPFPEVIRRQLQTKAIRGVYRSPSHPELKVIDKENGGKADALNAGINTAQYPLFCALDADGVLRFGHLWVGGDFVAGDPDGAGARAAVDPPPIATGQTVWSIGSDPRSRAPDRSAGSAGGQRVWISGPIASSAGNDPERTGDRRGSTSRCGGNSRCR